MSLLGNFFKSSKEPKEEKVLPWIALNSLSQLDDIVEKSHAKTQIIFKHSTRCGISRSVMNRFVSGYDFSEDQADLYYLDLLNYREVSNEVGFAFQVIHQSPQILIIKNGETVHHASHHNVDPDAILAFV